MLLSDYYVQKRDKLSQTASDAAYDIKLLICSALGYSESSFFMNMHTELTDADTARADSLVNRRLSGEPLQYVLGSWGFMGLDFTVSPACLIPRQDTETLAEFAIAEILRHNYATALDMCTGSGCIGITIAKKTAARVTLSDVSPDALAIARENAAGNGVSVDIVQSDMFENIRGTYDVITINPPYLTGEEMKNLQTEVTYEPEIALYGGTDGLKFYRIIADNYKKYLNTGGLLVMEIGYSQGEAIKALFPGVRIIPDLAGRDRTAAVQCAIRNA